MPGEQILIPVSSTIAVSEGGARNIFLFLSTCFNMHLFIITACMWWGRGCMAQCACGSQRTTSCSESSPSTCVGSGD